MVAMVSQPENNTESYINSCPEDAQTKLRMVRDAIHEVAPDAIERTDYFEMPGYSYEGHDYNGMFVWFSYKNKQVRLHLRPPVIQEHKHEVKDYKTTKAIVNFPLDNMPQKALIQKLILASRDVMRAANKD